MSLRRYECVQKCPSFSETRLSRVLTAGLKLALETDVKRKCLPIDCKVCSGDGVGGEDDVNSPPIDQSRVSNFKIVLVADSQENSFSSAIFCENEKHLVLLGDIFKSAMKNALDGSDPRYRMMWDETVRMTRADTLRRWIVYEGRGNAAVAFEEFEGKVNMENLTSDIQKRAYNKSHEIMYVKVNQNGPVAKIEALPPSAPYVLNVSIEGRLTVSEVN